MENGIAIAQKVAEEISLDKEEIESYSNLIDGINALVFIFLKKQKSRSEISELSKNMHKICRKYLKYNSKTECYDPPNSRRYSYIEFLEEDDTYKNPSSAPKLKIMKSFLKMAQSGKYKNRTQIYTKLTKEFGLCHTSVVNYCKGLSFDRGESL